MSTSGRTPPKAENRAEQERLSRRAQRKLEAERRARQRRMLFVAVPVVIAVIAAGIGIWLNQRSAQHVAAVQMPDVSKYTSVPRDGRILGDPNAPVHVIEWGDYQCPACRSFEQRFFPTILEQYIATGKVRWEFRDFAFIGSESTRAAEAAYCALDQGKFWEFHAALYANQTGENVGSFSDRRLEEIARVVGLDVDAFRSCLRDEKHADAVQQMVREAQSLGVRATPSFSVNGSAPFTISSLADLTSRIEEALP
ncbi:MAG: DsbA family protein [Thermomicrobium sp.]|nr:DsbA family protein [Thermomicrobium sp.]MDW8060175.1 DsbA family protein [Thermomicrobium sp.]